MKVSKDDLANDVQNLVKEISIYMGQSTYPAGICWGYLRKEDLDGLSTWLQDVRDHVRGGSK